MRRRSSASKGLCSRERARRRRQPRQRTGSTARNTAPGRGGRRRAVLRSRSDPLLHCSRLAGEHAGRVAGMWEGDAIVTYLGRSTTCIGICSNDSISARPSTTTGRRHHRMQPRRRLGPRHRPLDRLVQPGEVPERARRSTVPVAAIVSGCRARSGWWQRRGPSKRARRSGRIARRMKGRSPAGR
jgi:hypothetical protein